MSWLKKAQSGYYHYGYRENGNEKYLSTRTKVESEAMRLQIAEDEARSRGLSLLSKSKESSVQRKREPNTKSPSIDLSSAKLHERFLMLRTWKKISKKEAALLLDCHENTVSRLEEGKCIYSKTFEKAEKWANKWLDEFYARPKRPKY